MYMFQCMQHVSDLCIQSCVVLQFLMKTFFRHLIEIFSDVFQFLMSCWTCEIISLVCLATGGSSYKGGPSLF